ncbi:ATP-dependent RNA helicase HrpA [Nocardioides jishulii]|uniref:ATP-dependent RNA helicase HrpA n=1 Tax=Nocardioides jishulii TaxID=2575440 RepID=A0A4U2YHS6_9ACTN|nr:ATP-dependent RNA helicase HrpA [Nocardioides jishulii]QCX26611.1 ATP-dependent RNA helicase HrpA [Nocardioides jishulii]TKI60420.1 ATP-dependent RNA helicase HrpA [Nocardioides jishulii]
MSAPTEPTLAITYPEHLPVSQRRDDIAAAIRDHQVVIVAGETGSGKTTQLPKICLELGRGRRRGRGDKASGGLIGHTQPRRIAARSVAERISEELAADGIGTGLGDVVGYQVRFTDQTSRSSRVKLMTDGILLAELQRDRMLRRYDTIIIDEAHERSLNIDFLLGYLRRLLPKRPDLKLIVTSATIDVERFAQHFAERDGTPAPIIEVSGRTYPVEVRYRPLMELGSTDEEGETVVRDQTEAIVDAVRELSTEGPGDVLVFLPGEREIRDTADAFDALKSDRLEIVPLYSRLSAAEQHRVFSSHPASVRRVVLATNVAETSLTVPGIKYVVDTGVARISRYSVRTKVQRLPIEPISQASANQRSGRCGRVSEGIAIRLYSEEDFEGRPEFTDPEILRTNLASVILQMTSLGLGDIARFPFVEPPDKRNVSAGVQLLEELGAFSTKTSDQKRLTKLGQRLARLPIDPRLGRMILEAEQMGCVRDVIVIAAALSLQDPRERPADAQAQADQLHARFKDKTSDFLTWLNLWQYVKQQQRDLSSSAFRRMCKREYLNYLRMREWQDFESQLRQVCKEMKVDLGQARGRRDVNEEGEGGAAYDADGIHQALLAGLLSHIGALEERERPRPGAKPTERRQMREYLGARGSRFAIFPGSALKGANPPFVMAGELVETSRLWARQNAAIKPEWAERLGSHLVKRSFSEPAWSKKRAAVMAKEKVTLYGVTLVSDRAVNYGSIDPEVARELFIRHALVQGEWDELTSGRHKFFTKNSQLLAEAEELEHRARRRDIVVDEHTLFDFYDQRIPADIVSGAHFERWWKQERRVHGNLLTFSLDMLTHDTAEEVAASDFPTQWHGESLTFPISYHFEPGAADDGLTIEVPVATLNQVEADDFSWLVPGLREELVVNLIRTLPKQLRVSFVPAPNTAKAFLAAVPPGEEPLLDSLERFLRATTGVHVPREAWDLDKLPAHLRPTFKVVGDNGKVAAAGKDLDALKAPLRPTFAAAMAEVAQDTGVTATGQTTWTFGTIETSFTQRRAGHEVRGYPALTDEGATVGLGVFGSSDEAAARHRLGVRRLLLLALPSAELLLDGLSNLEKLALASSPYPTVQEMVEDLRAAVVGDVVDARPAVRDQAAYDALLAVARTELQRMLPSAFADLAKVLAAWRETEKALSGRADLYTLPALTDMRAQLERLVHRGFLGEAGAAQLRHYPRYLAAIVERREKLAGQVARDRQLMDQVADLQESWLHQMAALPQGRPPTAHLREARWMLEEYRVQLWAQHLGTAMKVSDQRIRKALG